MPDSILLNSESRLLGNSGIADFAHYGAQPDPIVSFAPAPTDSRPIDPLGTAMPAQRTSVQPDESGATSPLDGTLAYLPPASGAAPLSEGLSAPAGHAADSGPSARMADASPADIAASPSPMGTGSLSPAQFQPIFEDSGAANPLAAALAPTSLEPANIGSASPVADQLLSNVSALQSPAAQILSGAEDGLGAPLAAGVVAPVTDTIVSPVVSGLAAPVDDVTATIDQAAEPLATPVGEIADAGIASAAPVGEAAQPVLSPVAEGATEAVAVTAQPAAEAAVAPVTETLAEAAAPITGPSVDAGIAMLVDLVQAADMTVPTPPGAEPTLEPSPDSGSIVDTLAAPEPEDSLLGVGHDGDSSSDDGDNQDSLGLGGV